MNNKRSKQSRQRGLVAECVVADYLKKQGAHIVRRNYYCRYGEIDLIIEDEAMLAFVEVRKRANWSFAANSIGLSKQRKIQAATAYYLALHGEQYCCCRFDVVLVNHHNHIKWIKSAFAMDDC